ncbi:uncharacterized protein LOC115580327 [Sparus aurata]|uniref:uncharacterized protein LOC115580327 n=1 Tax=Sparus aurata TaxID=8175 RepID=UPI0011C17147|nr:uncharacterized protein LOC115580327 [Sparus aurata]
MESKRKPNWREEETLLLVEIVEERKLIIKGKFSTTLTSHDKKQAWEDISNQLNASQTFSHWSPADCEKKWYNGLSKSRSEIAAFKTCSMRTGGGPPGKDLSAVAEVVQRILGEDNPSISGLDGGQDPAAMKLELLSKGLDRDALGESPVSPGISDAHSPSAFDAVQPGPSTSCEATGNNQVAEVSDCEPAEETDDLQALQRQKIKLQIKVLRLQEEYYSLALKKKKRYRVTNKTN